MNPRTNQIDCFLMKKYLSPIVEFPSVREAIEIKTKPIIIKLIKRISNGDLDFFIGQFI